MVQFLPILWASRCKNEIFAWPGEKNVCFFSLLYFCHMRASPRDAFLTTLGSVRVHGEIKTLFIVIKKNPIYKINIDADNDR